ncbi:MAG TPA: hypothetical protein VFA99_18435 [Acidobacteriaceae bacterium]|nr:hypothetical protein [Acidobacteriaceae bacterium]
MVAVKRGLFIILGAATAATTLGGWATSASAQAGKKAKVVKAASKGHKGSTSGTGTSTGTSGTGTSTGTGTTGTGTSTGTSGTGTTTGTSGSGTGTSTGTSGTGTTTGTSGSGTGTGTGTTGTGTGTSTLVQYFPVAAVWTQDVSAAVVDPNSAAMINQLASQGGWGLGSMKVDESIRVMQANSSTPMVPFQPGSPFYTPDSDNISSVPLPAGGGMEGQTGYQCDTSQYDCHFIVVDNGAGKLYEAYGANYNGSAVTANFIGVWDLNVVYPATGRGEQCTSADAAGFPIAPLLFNADELKSGQINHAIRFILPNNEMRAGFYVHPATHAGAPSGPSNAIPYGAHLRLKASYDISALKPAAQVVAKAMQKYGMFLADGGSIALTAQSDQDTQTKYTDVDFGTQDLSSLKVTDFEVVTMPTPIPKTNNCVRNNIP